MIAALLVRIFEVTAVFEDSRALMISSADTIFCSEKSSGRVQVMAVRAWNVPSLDSGGPAGGETDVKIRVTIGNTVLESQAVDNTLNPVWTAEEGTVDFGVRFSGEPVTIEVLDEDSGFEGDDDLITTFDTQVIKCSMFSSQAQCTESVVIPLDPSSSCLLPNNMLNTEASCIIVGMRVIPLFVEIVGVTNQTQSTLGIANAPIPTEDFYPFVYAGDTSNFVVSTEAGFVAAKDGIIVRMPSEYKTSTSYNILKFRANYRSTVFVFFPETANELFLPTWLQNGGEWTRTKVRCLITLMLCFPRLSVPCSPQRA